MKRILIVASILLLPTLGIAHEGHDKIPSAQVSKMVPPGQVKTTSLWFVELKEEQGTVKVLIFDHDRKDIPTNELQIVASVKFPRKSKTEKVEFLPVGNMFEAKVNAKNSHRYTLDMMISHKGKSEKLSFIIEPQR